MRDLSFFRMGDLDGSGSGASGFQEKINAKCAKAYSECVEKFLKSIGVTVENAAEYEFRTHRPGSDLNAEIWHNGFMVGKITTRWETDNGYRFVVECTQVAEAGR